MKSALARGQFDGVRRVVMRAEGLAVLDLDHCRDAATGVISTEAQEIITKLNSYTDVLCTGLTPPSLVDLITNQASALTKLR